MYFLSVGLTVVGGVSGDNSGRMYFLSVLCSKHGTEWWW